MKGVTGATPSESSGRGKGSFGAIYRRRSRPSLRRFQLPISPLQPTDLFRSLAARCPSDFFYHSLRGLRHSVSALGSNHALVVKSQVLSGEEATYAAALCGKISKTKLKTTFLVDQRFLCRHECRAINSTLLLTAARAPQVGAAWEARCRRAGEGFKMLGIDCGVGVEAVSGYLAALLSELSDACTPVVASSVITAAWKTMPLYTVPEAVRVPGSLLPFKRSRTAADATKEAMAILAMPGALGLVGHFVSECEESVKLGRLTDSMLWSRTVLDVASVIRSDSRSRAGTPPRGAGPGGGV